MPKIMSGVFLACVLFAGFLYANNDIGVTATNLETDIRSSQKIKDDWNVDGSIADTMAAFISCPQNKADVLPVNTGSITFYDVNGQVVEYHNNPL